ncbi:MAG: STAS domain-containing protein [Armatimonadota bacterium]
MGVPPFEVLKSFEDGSSILHIRGELDFGTAGVLQDALTQVLEEDVAHLILNMEDVTFLDSEGVKILLQAHRKVSDRGGVMSIRNCSQFVQNVFEILGLQQYLEISVS